MAHLYVWNPQARVGGVGSLVFDSLEELRLKGITGTDAFKTRDTYGTQFIVVCPASLKVLEAWVKWIRPTIATDDSEDVLFINSAGNPHSHLGTCVTNFFSQWGYHITTTALR